MSKSTRGTRALIGQFNCFVAFFTLTCTRIMDRVYFRLRSSLDLCSETHLNVGRKIGAIFSGEMSCVECVTPYIKIETYIVFLFIRTD